MATKSGWSIPPSVFTGVVKERVTDMARVISIQILNEIVSRSPVGNPELWAINATAVKYNNAVTEHNDALRNEASNLTKSGRLKKGLKVTDSMDIRAPAGYRPGMFRASNFVSIGAPTSAVASEPDPNGGATLSAGTQTIMQSPAFPVIYIQNNLPYAKRLEDGHSTQAPQGVYFLSFNGVIMNYTKGQK